MIATIIPVAIIAASLAIIMGIVIRRFPDLAALKVETMNSARHSEVKKRLVGERLARKFRTSAGAVGKRLKPGATAVSAGFSRLLERARAMEKKYEKQAEPVRLEERKEFEAGMSSLLSSARELAERGKYAEAEKALISAVSQDPKSEAPYRALGELYVEMKEYGQAEETYKYVLAMHQERSQQAMDLEDAGDRDGPAPDALPPEAAQDVFELARVYVAADKPDDAIASLERALDLDTKNPRYLDLYLETCLAAKDKLKAREALKRLKEANPDNQKLPMLEKRVKALS